MQDFVVVEPITNIACNFPSKGIDSIINKEAESCQMH